jgi:predicted aldo/keto reductase-like oxidoreductase
MRFLLFLLRTNQQKIKGAEHDEHHHEERCAAALLGTLCVGATNKKIHDCSHCLQGPAGPDLGKLARYYDIALLFDQQR